jgi:hypothetical protein
MGVKASEANSRGVNGADFTNNAQGIGRSGEHSVVRVSQWDITYEAEYVTYDPSCRTVQLKEN